MHACMCVQARRSPVAPVCFTCSWASAGICVQCVCNVSVCICVYGLSGRRQRGTARGGQTQQVQEEEVVEGRCTGTEVVQPMHVCGRIQIRHVQLDMVALSGVSADNSLPTRGLACHRYHLSPLIHLALSVHCYLYQSLEIIYFQWDVASRPPYCPLAPCGTSSALEPLTNECQSGGLWHFYCRHLP